MRNDSSPNSAGAAGRQFHLASWELTFACGVVKMAIAIAAAAAPVFQPSPASSTIGWMLLAGGLTELLLALRGLSSWIGRLTLGSGAVTVIAGAVFIYGNWTGLFPLTHYVMIWLLLRGIVALDVARLSRKTPAANWGWILLRGAVDLGLGLMLAIGAPFAMIILVVFGDTGEVTGAFFFILAASFAAAGAGLAATALAQRRLHLATPFLNDAKE